MAAVVVNIVRDTRVDAGALRCDCESLPFFGDIGPSLGVPNGALHESEFSWVLEIFQIVVYAPRLRWAIDTIEWSKC